MLDTLMANAWPALVDEEHAGWRFRWTRGVTRRANSAWALGGDADTLDDLITHAEMFFGDREAPARILVSTASSPPALADRLAVRHFQPTARTLVARAATDDLLAAAPPGRDAEVTSAVTDEWLDAFLAIEAGARHGPGATDVYRDQLLAPDLPMAFVTVRAGGRVAAVGQLVVEAGMAGVQCMATDPAHRRQGLAGSVMRHLGAAARELGAAAMYLAVMADNTGAGALYERLGFRPVHEYAYFEPES